MGAARAYGTRSIRARASDWRSCEAASKIRWLAAVASVLWLLGTGLGILGAPLIIELWLVAFAYGILMFGIWLAKSLLSSRHPRGEVPKDP